MPAPGRKAGDGVVQRERHHQDGTQIDVLANGSEQKRIREVARDLLERPERGVLRDAVGIIEDEIYGKAVCVRGDEQHRQNRGQRERE